MKRQQKYGQKGDNVDKEHMLQDMLPFWDKLSDSDQKLIADHAQEEKFKRSMVISRTDEDCKGAIILHSGQFRIYIISDEGREVTLYRLHAGDMCVLSASCLLDSIEFDVIIEAVEDTDATLIPAGILHQIKERNPYAELFLSKTANERFSDVMWTMQQILFMKTDRRVAIFLWDEITKTKNTTITYTHDEVARFIGSAREVVTRILKYFADEEIVKLNRGKIEIIDKDKLRAYV